MPSKHMLPKGKRRHTVKPEYRATRGVEAPPPPVIPVVELEDDAEEQVHTFTTAPEAAGMRLDQYLAQAISDISRSRVQFLIEHGKVRVNGQAAKAKLKLQGGELDRNGRRPLIRHRSTHFPRTSSRHPFRGHSSGCDRQACRNDGPRRGRRCSL